MSKQIKEKMSAFSLLKTLNKELIPIQHRGQLVKLLNGVDGYCPHPADDYEPIKITEEYFFTVRLPFEDYGDLVIDNKCLEYLELCLKNLYIAYPILENPNPDVINSEPVWYQAYLQVLAITAVKNFVYKGVVEE